MPDVETIYIDWSDVKARLISMLERNERWDQAVYAYLHRFGLIANPYQRVEWVGGSGADALKWLRKGFHAPELKAAVDHAPAAKRIQPVWSDEDGDPDPGRLIGGYDAFFFALEPRDTKPGLRLEVDMFFSAGVPAKTIKEYGAWVAGVIRALEAQGYDLEIVLVAPMRNLYGGENHHDKRADVRVTVKRFNELSDFTEWSVCFSPVGTRVVMFTAFGVASEQIGRHQSRHMGTSLGTAERTWGATYDAESNKLTITADQRAWTEGAFERMTQTLKTEGLL